MRKKNENIIISIFYNKKISISQMRKFLKKFKINIEKKELIKNLYSFSCLAISSKIILMQLIVYPKNKAELKRIITPTNNSALFCGLTFSPNPMVTMTETDQNNE